MQALFKQVQRIDARMVRGFAELGARVMDDSEWCRVDHAKMRVYLKGAGRSIQMIRTAILSCAGYPGGVTWYDIMINDEKAAIIKVVPNE